MRTFGREDLKSLLQVRGTPCVSIFMPTHRMGPDTKEDPIRLKNLLGSAEEQLVASGLRAPQARELLAPARALLHDTLFWRHQGDGLALFLSPGVFHHYELPLRWEELLVVSNRFHLKPLIPMLSHNGRFFVLALSQDQVRLLLCTRFGSARVDLDGLPVPRNIDEALAFDQPEKQHQYHTGTEAPGTPMATRWWAAFHGQGVTDQVKDDLRRYFLQIDRGLHEVLCQERLPLVLAGVEYLLSIYKGVASYDHILDQGVTGNPEGLRDEELQRQAWALAEPYLLQPQREAAQRYRDSLGTGLASNDLKEVLTAAYQGRVSALFVALDTHRWGTFDPVTGAVQVNPAQEPTDEDLLDLAAAYTILNSSGDVFAVPQEEMPNREPLAAVYRY